MRKKKIKKYAILALFTCCVFLSATEIIQRSVNSDIESIVVEKDNLIIKSKGKTYTFKFSELLKTKNTQTKKLSPKNLNEAFQYNGDWYFFRGIKSKPNRLKEIDKRSYKLVHEGNIFERVLYKGKYYARDLNKKVYEPYWTMKKDFSPHLINAKQYIELLDNKIKSFEKNIQELKPKKSKNEETLNLEKEKYITFLRKNNQTKLDKNGNVVQNNGKYTSKIKKELRLYKKNIKKHEKNLNALERNLKYSERRLSSLRRFKNSSQALYKRAISKTIEIPVL